MEVYDVWLHVYDVTTAQNDMINQSIVRVNHISRNFLKVGGIFHGAVEVYGREWSYGYSDYGTGVFDCPPAKNPFYQYREKVYLGKTNLSKQEVNAVLKFLIKSWPGRKYELLSNNCCHFCDCLVAELGLAPLPAWVNRFAGGALQTITTTSEISEQLRNQYRECQVSLAGFGRAIASVFRGQKQAARAAPYQRLEHVYDSVLPQQGTSSQEPTTTQPEAHSSDAAITSAGQQLRASPQHPTLRDQYTNLQTQVQGASTQSGGGIDRPTWEVDVGMGINGDVAWDPAADVVLDSLYSGVVFTNKGTGRANGKEAVLGGDAKKAPGSGQSLQGVQVQPAQLFRPYTKA